MPSEPWREPPAVERTTSKICLTCDGVSTTEAGRCAHCGASLLPTAAVHFPARRGEADATNPLLGSVLDGKFLLQGVLGRGGMGTVFRACHAVSLAPLAVKLLHPRLSARVEWRRALVAEARKAARVVDERCARVLDVGESEDGTVYLAMELVAGEPLDEWMRRGPVEPAVAVDVLTQIARALAAIHDAGLVHCDLSARNVMVSVRGGRPIVKVLDFGIAQSARKPTQSATAAHGESLFANPVFSAPEQLAGGDVDPRADIYSLGVLAFLLLCGKLPIDERDARAAMRATVAGQRQAMPHLPGSPRRLQQFVERCLSRDREQRPSGADAAIHELTSIAGSDRRALPGASIVAALGALVFALLAFVQSTPPFLRVAGGPLALREGPVADGDPVRHLKPEALRNVRALYGGFSPGRLELEVTRDGALQWRAKLDPTVVGEGVLLLSDSQQSWREALARIVRASADGPVGVAFVAPGSALLGGARLCLDDTPPRTEIRMLGDGAPRLGAGSLAEISVRDATGLSSLQVALRLDSGASHEVAAPPGGGRFQVGAAFAKTLPPSAPLGKATLSLVATDLAGNRSESEALTLEDCDFGAPEVLDVAGPDGESSIPYLEGKAVARVRLSFDESSLRVQVRDDTGRFRADCMLRSKAASWHEFEIDAAAEGDPFAPGIYGFTVIDAAGNRTERTMPLAFRSRRLDAVFAQSPGGGIAALGKELACGPDGGAVSFNCGASFVPVAASVRPAGAAGVAVRAELQPQGRDWSVRIPPLAVGRHEVVLELEERGGRALGTVDFAMPLQALPRALRLRVPDARSRFLPGLVQANVLRAQEGSLSLGAGVTVEGGLSRFLRGSVWHGPSPEDLAQTQLGPSETDPDLTLPPLPLLRGRNVICVQLRDVLDRPVEAWIGDRELGASGQGDGSRVTLADFHDDPTPPNATADEFLVEFGQPLRLRLRSPLPFQPSDSSGLRLSLRGVEMAAASVRATDSGSEVTFVLPYANWRDAAGFDGLQRADYERGRVAEVFAQFTTPAGDHAIQVRLRTARSTLRALRLSDLATKALPPELAAITLIPVLSPEGGEWKDPVPHDDPMRGLYRQRDAEPVRGMNDWFVQDREFTLGQYAALAQAAAATASGAARLTHRDDPQGTNRLSLENMTPSVFLGDSEAFLRAASQQPASAVAGVDFFQAYAASRLVGELATGDAGLFRLPLGCELELAGFGSAPAGGARHAANARGVAVSVAPWSDAARTATSLAGASAEFLAAIGDRVPVSSESDVYGIDFGLREWSLDLAQGPDPGGEALVREWTADRELHVQRALELSGGRTAPPDQEARLPADLRARLRTFGVVRGLACGEPVGLTGADGREIDTKLLVELPASVPGVLRAEQMRRDGRGLLPGEPDSRLRFTGFRLAGGSVFLQRVRSR